VKGGKSIRNINCLWYDFYPWCTYVFSTAREGDGKAGKRQAPGAEVFKSLPSKDDERQR
jgi:hypothetical protein